MSPQTAKPRGWRGLLIPAALLFAVLIALGSWQIQRKTWKEGVIAALNERLAAPPLALPAPSAWPSLDQASDEYRRVTFSAELDHGREALVYAAPSALRPDASAPGYWIFTPARLAGGGVVIVNRGFVPLAHREGVARAPGQVAGRLEIVGALRWPERRTWFSPSDDPNGNLWFTRDPRAIAAAKGLGSVAPFYVGRKGRRRPADCRGPARSWRTCGTNTCNMHSRGSASPSSSWSRSAFGRSIRAASAPAGTPRSRPESYLRFL